MTSPTDGTVHVRYLVDDVQAAVHLHTSHLGFTPGGGGLWARQTGVGITGDRGGGAGFGVCDRPGRPAVTATMSNSHWPGRGTATGEQVA